MEDVLPGAIRTARLLSLSLSSGAPLVKTQKKVCKQCGSVLRRKRYPSGATEPKAQFANRAFCGLQCFHTSRRKHPCPDNYGSIHRDGYRLVYDKVSKTMQLEHRVVWIARHGAIPQGTQVHHKNGNRLDNRIENLELLKTVEHRKRHAGYVTHSGVTKKTCRQCRKLLPLGQFYRKDSGLTSHCRKCLSEYSRKRYLLSKGRNL